MTHHQKWKKTKAQGPSITPAPCHGLGRRQEESTFENKVLHVPTKNKIVTLDRRMYLCTWVDVYMFLKFKHL